MAAVQPVDVLDGGAHPLRVNHERSEIRVLNLWAFFFKARHVALPVQTGYCLAAYVFLGVAALAKTDMSALGEGEKTGLNGYQAKQTIMQIVSTSRVDGGDRQYMRGVAQTLTN